MGLNVVMPKPPEILYFPGQDETPLSKLEWARFRNDSGETIPPFSAMKVVGFDVDDIDEQYLVVEQSDTFGSQCMHAINGPLSVSDGNTGRCVFGGGLAVAKYESSDGAPAFGELWGPRDAGWKLRKNTGGFRVLKITSTSKNIMLVQREPFLEFRGIADGDIAADDRGTVSIYYRNASTSDPFYTDTTVNMPDVLNDLDDTVATSAMVICRYDPLADGTVGWKIIQGDC